MDWSCHTKRLAESLLFRLNHYCFGRRHLEILEGSLKHFLTILLIGESQDTSLHRQATQTCMRILLNCRHRCLGIVHAITVT